MKRLRYICCFFIFILIFIQTSSSYATTVDKQLSASENELAYIKSQIQKGQYLIEETNKETAVVLEEIEKINILIKETQADVDSLLVEIKQKEDMLNEIIDIKETTTYNFSNITNKFEEMMNSVTGGESYLEWIDNTSSTTTLMLRLQQLSIVYDIYNMALNKSLSDTTDITAKEGTVLYEKQQLEYQKAMYLQKQKYIQELYNDKLKVYQELSNQVMEYAEELDSLEISSLQLVDVINELQSYGYKNGSGVTLTNGIMSWPAKKGTLSSEFGYRIHPIHKVKKLHKGIDIGGGLTTGEPVLAAYSGIVITSGWIDGYGYTVMIDHGDKVCTLYAHNSELNVSVGDEVVTGQVIAKVGSTGLSTGPHIHFEVRVNGEATDPRDWLKVVYEKQN